MDPRSKEILQEILEKPVAELNEEDKAFLRARRSYLKKSQLEEYDSIINLPQKEEKVEVPLAEAPLYVSGKDKQNQTSEESEPVKEDNGEA